MKESSEIFEELKIVIHSYSEDEEKKLLLEARNVGEPLVGKYSSQKHAPHSPTGEYHLHVYNRNNQIFSINKSGTAHDGYHGAVIPKKAYDALKKKYPEWIWPDNRIIESQNVLFVDINDRVYLRPVIVASFKIRNKPNEFSIKYSGFFHGYAEVIIGSSIQNGTIIETQAIVEDMYGELVTVPIQAIKFLDV